MQKGLEQMLRESHGVNLCFETSSVPFHMDSSIDLGAGNVMPPVTSSQAVQDDAGAAEGVDINGKSVHKPKRKKHRPKVIKEIQSTKSRKPKTPNPPKEKVNQPTGKRKYVRRKGLNAPANQSPTGGTDIQARAEPEESQRCLNFDREEPHGNTNLVSQTQVTQIPTCPGDTLTSISGVERSNVQVPCHWGDTNNFYSSVDPMADLKKLRVDSMPKRAIFDLNNSVISQMPVSCSNPMDSSVQSFQYGSRGIVQTNRLVDSHYGMQIRSSTHLSNAVNQMQNSSSNLDQYIGTSQSSIAPRHDQMLHRFQMPENPAAPQLHLSPEASIREGVLTNQMGQFCRPQYSTFAPPRHIERDAMNGDLNEFSAKNNYLNCGNDNNYQVGAGFGFCDSPDFSGVLATGRKRDHNAFNGHQISFGMDFDSVNRARQFCNDHHSTSSQTSYFPETCKRMRPDNISNQLNRAMGNISSSSMFSGNWKVSAIKPGACTLADVQRLMAREKSRASQQMIDFENSGSNMVRQHIKPALQNVVHNDYIALPGKEFGSFTVQHIQLPGSTTNPLGESNILRNRIYQPQSCEIRPSQHHSSDNFSLPDKWSTYLSTGHTQLPIGTEFPSIESYIQKNANHQLHSLENIVVEESVLFSETPKMSTQDDTVNNYNTAANTDSQVRKTNAEAARPPSQPPSKSTGDGSCHLESSKLSAEAKSTEKRKVRGRPRKDANANGTPQERNTTGNNNVGRAKKRASSKGANSEISKTDGITYASDPSTGTIPKITTTESERYGEKTSNVLKTSDHHSYSGTSKETHGGFISQATALSVDSVDAIIQKIMVLSINGSDKIIAEVPKNALVPYEGGFGALVPFEGKVKKSRSRAKVNIDPVTTLMWNLLMGPDASENAEGLDKDKEKWLEEERRVFRGRIDSFIARMHLVQGDRRFSPWKGSVVDSVVGVFLTQNVSDHLSSSAFMAVAAKFPAKSEVPEKPVADISDTPREQNDNCSGLFGDSTKLQGKLFVEDTSDIRSLITTEDNEESNSNELIGSSSAYGINRVAEGCPVSHRKSLTVSHENGPPGSVFATFGFSCVVEAEDGSLEDVISSQNSVVSSQNSPEHLFHRTDLLGSSVQSFTDEGYIMRNMSNGIGTSTEYSEVPSMQDPKNMSNRNAGSSEYHEGNFPVSGVNKGVLLDLNRSYQPVHSSISYVQNGQSNFPGVSCLNNMDQSFYTGPDRVNLSSVAQSGTSQPSSSRGTKNKTKITDPSSHLLYRTNGSVSQERTSCTSEPSQQGDFSPIIKQNFQTSISTEDLSFSKDHSFYGDHFLRNKTETSFVEPHSCSNLQEMYTTTTNSIGGQQLKLGCNQLDNDVRVQTTEHGNYCSSNLCENQNSHSNVLQGVASGSTQKFIDTQKGPLEVPMEGSKSTKVRGRPKKKDYDWDSLRKEVLSKCGDKQRSHNAKDTVDWEAVRQADVRKISETIRERGMNNMLAERIKEFLNRLVRDHGSIDLEWLRDVQPDKAKDYLLSIRGLGLKSVECVRLLTLHHMAFPVDTNVGRICVRLGWVPLQPLPESLQLHLLEMYPMLEQIQKYLWPRLCKLDQRTLYELHYQMITFGKVFCTKSKPNCNSCPMRAECKHFASAFASARLALPGPHEKSLVTSKDPNAAGFCRQTYTDSRTVGQLEWNANHPKHAISGNHQPIIEEPPSPEPEPENSETRESAIEDFSFEDPDEIPFIDLNIEKFTQNLKSYMQANNLEIEHADMSKALVAITPEAASIPTPKLKNVSRLRTEHHVYELPNEHPLLEGLDPREPDDPCPYLLSIWTPGETAQSTDAPKVFCNSEETGKLCGSSTCFRCNNIRETQADIVRGTLLIPCRTAMRGSFPLNGTYFQVNEVFADHDSSRNPIHVPRNSIWHLPRRTVYFGTSIPTIFRGLTTEEIQQCFWRGFVCVRGFDRTVRAPRPLYARLHFPASKVVRGKKPGAARVEE